MIHYINNNKEMISTFSFGDQGVQGPEFLVISNMVNTWSIKLDVKKLPNRVKLIRDLIGHTSNIRIASITANNLLRVAKKSDMKYFIKNPDELTDYIYGVFRDIENTRGKVKAELSRQKKEILTALFSDVGKRARGCIAEIIEDARISPVEVKDAIEDAKKVNRDVGVFFFVLISARFSLNYNKRR